MTTALAIITGALRQSNLISLQATPNAAQETEGLNKLNTLIASALGFEIGTKLFEFPVGTEGTDEVVSGWSSADWRLPPPNVRLMVSDQTAQTITLPPFPDNGARIALVDLHGEMSLYPITLHANGKLIEGAGSLVINIDDARLEWMYRADIGEWVRITLLASGDSLPFPLQFDDYFETMLAMRLNPRYGRAADPQTIATLRRAESQIRSSYRQSRAVHTDLASLRMSETGRGGVSDEGVVGRNHAWMR